MVAIGRREGVVAGVKFEIEQVPYKDVDTVTLYLNQKTKSRITTIF